MYNYQQNAFTKNFNTVVANMLARRRSGRSMGPVNMIEGLLKLRKVIELVSTIPLQVSSTRYPQNNRSNVARSAVSYL